jgi:hypothetical protein
MPQSDHHDQNTQFDAAIYQHLQGEIEIFRLSFRQWCHAVARTGAD